MKEIEGKKQKKNWRKQRIGIHLPRVAIDTCDKSKFFMCCSVSLLFSKLVFTFAI